MVAAPLLAETRNLDRLRRAQLTGPANCLTPVACRTARAALGWTQAKLAQKAHISIDSLQRLEHGTGKVHPNHIAALLNAL